MLAWNEFNISETSHKKKKFSWRRKVFFSIRGCLHSIIVLFCLKLANWLLDKNITKRKFIWWYTGTSTVNFSKFLSCFSFKVSNKFPEEKKKKKFSNLLIKNTKKDYRKSNVSLSAFRLICFMFLKAPCFDMIKEKNPLLAVF